MTYGSNYLSHPDDIGQHRKSSRWHPALVHTSSGWDTARWHRVQLTLCHPDDLGNLRMSSGWQSALAISHSDDVINLIPKSSGWLRYSKYPSRMTHGHCRMSSGWLTIFPHLIQMTRHYVIWTLNHPDELAPARISSGSLNWRWYLIRQIHFVIPMTYSPILCHPDDSAEVGISSGWVSAMLLCHPDEIRLLS